MPCLKCTEPFARALVQRGVVAGHLAAYGLALVALVAGCGSRRLSLGADSAALAGDGAVAGDSVPSGAVEPRLLFFRTPDPAGGEPTSHALPVVDREGHQLFDLAERVRAELGAGPFELREMAVDGQSVSLPSSFRTYWPPQLYGQQRRLLPTQIVLKVQKQATGKTMLLGFDGDGRTTFRLELEEDLSGLAELQPSPSGHYLIGSQGTQMVVIDLRSGGVNLRGAIGPYQRAFAPDKDTLAYVVDQGAGWSLVLRDLGRGTERVVELPPWMRSLRAPMFRAATADGYVLALDSEQQGLWFVYDDGRFSPLQSELFTKVRDDVLALTAEGSVIFRRTPLSSADGASLGYYSFDPQRRADPVQALPISPRPTATRVMGYASGRLLALQPTEAGTLMLALPVDGAPPETLTLLPAVPDPWTWTASSAAEGTLLVANLELYSARLLAPPLQDGTLVFDGRGKLLQALPNGTTRVDREGRLAVHLKAGPTPAPPQVLDLTMGTALTLKIQELSFALVYRLP